MAIAVAHDWSNYCPSCGEWKDLADIVEELGWCSECVLEHLPNYVTCKDCGLVHKRRGNDHRCHRCAQNTWLSQNADRVEELMLVEGLSLHACRLRIRMERKTHCCICGAVVVASPGGLVGRKYRFCNKHHKASATFRYYRITAGYSEDEAFERVRERFGNKHQNGH